MTTLLENPKNKNISEQIETLVKILKLNKTAWKVLETAEKAIKHPWYLAGGGIYHTVWNYFSNNPIEASLKDYDVFYFKENHNQQEHEILEKSLNSIFEKPIIDLTNIATVHEWLKETLHKNISPYKSIEENFNSFGNSVASIGVRKNKDGVEVYAPYGLRDMFSFEVHYFEGIFTREEYLKKTQSWQRRWPSLKIHV